MRLNPDCVRDIMLLIEKNDGSEPKKFIDIMGMAEELPAYEYDEIVYHFEQCILNNYLFGGKIGADTFVFEYMSPTGHEFLNEVRDDNIWNQVKEKFKSIADITVPLVGELAISVIKSKLGIS